MSLTWLSNTNIKKLGFAALFNLETTAQPQRHHYDRNPSRTSEEEPKKKKKIRKTKKKEQKYEQNLD